MRTIAVAGCMGHIGTTTQSIQAILTLKKMNKQVCYLESNKTNYLNRLVRLYSSAHEYKDRINYETIDMYKKNFANEVVKGNWDYVVRDYGTTDSDSFEETSFAEQFIKVVVCGTKPNEIFKTQELLKNPAYDDAFFIFSFVPEDEQVPIRGLMGSRAERTFFADIAIDPYHLTKESVETFSTIIKFMEEEE